MRQVLQQAGAIPYSLVDGELRVMLVTSLDTGRWLIPKGHVDPGLTPAEAATIEAYEEAGIRGTLDSDLPLGFFTYFKKYKHRPDSPASVQVFMLRVDEQCAAWPEMTLRQSAWFTPREAAQLVHEPGLATLLRRFAEVLGQGDDVDDGGFDERVVLN
jgi:8-oxo-dGTP pyrophosphatase MutT (NUDIX family)